MEIFSLIAYLIIGIVAGFVGGLLGLSGGVITVPSLFFVFNLLGFPQGSVMHTAIGTSLAAMILTGIASTWTHHRHKGVVWHIVLSMIPGVFVGGLLGPYIAHFLSGIVLEILFGLFICFLGAYILLKKKKMEPASPPDKTVFTWMGLLIGTLSSLFGIGGGVFVVPLLIHFRFTEKKAIGTSAATGLFITFFATIAYMYFGMKVVNIRESLGYIYLPAFFLIGIAAVFFAPLGAKWAHRMKGTKLRKIFAGALILIGILMIFH